MQTKKLYIIIILIGITHISYTQNYFCQCNKNHEHEKYLEEKLVGRIFVNPLVSNNLQFFNEWTTGEIYLQNGKTVKNKYLRYNGYLDYLLWLRESDYQTAIINRETVAGFKLYDKNNIPFAYFKNLKIKNWYTGDSTKLYLQVLAEGHISLYVHRQIKILNNNNELYKQYIYYICKDGVYHNLSLGRLSLLRFFADNKSKVRSIIRKNHLKVKQEDHLSEFVKLYNESIESER